MKTMRTLVLLATVILASTLHAQQGSDSQGMNKETQVMLVHFSLKERTIWVTSHDRTTRSIQTGRSIENLSLELLDVLQQLHRDGWKISAVSAEGTDSAYGIIGKTTYVLIREEANP